MVLWARSKFGAPMFEPDIFRKQMYFSEQMRHSDSAPGVLRPLPLPPSLRPCIDVGRGAKGALAPPNF